MTATRTAAKPVPLSGQIGICIGSSMLPAIALFEAGTPPVIRALAAAAIVVPLLVILTLRVRQASRS